MKKRLVTIEFPNEGFTLAKSATMDVMEDLPLELEMLSDYSGFFVARIDGKIISVRDH